MKKSFFIKYGSYADVPDVEFILKMRLDLEFVRHESSFVGEYSKYSGIYADSLTIVHNLTPSGEWRMPGNVEYPTLVEVAVVDGKNADKLARYKYIKKALSQMRGLHVLQDEVIESKG